MFVSANGARRALLAALACLLAACASTGAEKPDAPLTIAVDPKVEMTTAYYVTPGEALGQAIGMGVGGVVGGIVGGAIASGHAPQFSFDDKLAENHIDVGAILVEEMRKALAQQKGLQVVDDPSQAQLVMTLKVVKLGFESRGSGGGQMFLGIEHTVSGAAGQFSDNTEKSYHGHRNMEGYLKDPPLLASVFHQLAREAATAEMGDVNYRLAQYRLRLAEQ